MLNPSHKLTVSLIQQACTLNLDENSEKTTDAIKTAAKSGSTLIVLQELHRSTYFCQSETTVNFSLAETIPGPSTDHFSVLAKSLNVVIVLSLFEKRAPGLYHNTAVVIENDGSIAGLYRKMHIPDDPGFYEKFYFTPGDCGFKPIKSSVGNLGILICWDQWFPEAARLMALAGADLLIYPTAIGWDLTEPEDDQKRQYEAWKLMCCSHAIANGLPVLVCNRTGYELSPDTKAGIQFWGSSFVTGAQGEILAEGSIDSAEIITTELDLKNTEVIRQQWPFLRDRRIDAYQDLLKRYIPFTNRF